MPPELDVPAFREAYRRFAQNREKPVTEEAARLQFGHLAPLGVEQAIAQVEAAISSGWQAPYMPGWKLVPIGSAQGGGRVSMPMGGSLDFLDAAAQFDREVLGQ